MKLRLVLATLYIYITLAFSKDLKAGVVRDALPQAGGGGLLGGLISPDDPSTITSHGKTTTGASTAQTSTTSSLGDNILGLGGLLASATKAMSTTIATTAATTAKSTTSHSGSAGNSSISSPTGSTSSPLSPSTASTIVTATAASSASSAATTPNGLAGNSTGASQSKTWQIVGVAFVCVFAVALILVGVIFWDRITRFLGEALCGRSRSDGMEDFMPDWEKRSWEVKPRGEGTESEGHMHPAGSSSSDVLASAPQLMYKESGRHPFEPRRRNQEVGPGALPVYANFVSPTAQDSKAGEHRHSYSLMTTGELQRQNSRAVQDAYTAYA
ncbi:hypothetical protein HWV62_40942 [Athelia sp. TMB]|nr:hypothetical protein HWV62_40942 [Athelia sp. TMB]